MNTRLTELCLGATLALGLFAPHAGATDVNYDMSALTTGAGGTPAYLGNTSNGYATNPAQDNWFGQDVGSHPGTATTVWNSTFGIYAGQKVMHGGYNGLAQNSGSGANYNGKNFGVAYNQTGVVTTMLITFNVTNNVVPLGTGGGFGFYQDNNGLNAFFSDPAANHGVGMNLQIGGGGTSINVGYYGVGNTRINETGWSVPSWYFGSSAALTDWFSAKMVVDPTANSGDGGATCYLKDDTTNSAWVQFGATNIAIGRLANEGTNNAWTALTGVDLSINSGVEVRAFGIKALNGTTITPSTAFVGYPTNSTATIAVDSTGPWTASSDSAWAVVSPASGNYFNNTVTVTCAANTGSSVRTATITINGQTCVVSQGVAGTNVTYDMSALSTGAAGGPAYLGATSSGWNLNPLEDNWFGQDVGSAPGTAATVWDTNLGVFTGQKVIHGGYNGLPAIGSGSCYSGKNFGTHYNADGVTSVVQITFNATNCVAPLGGGGGFNFRQNNTGTNPFWNNPAANKGVGMALEIGGNSSYSSFQFHYFGVGSTELNNTGVVWFQPSSFVSGATLTDWYTLKMVVDPTANGGHGGATCYWRDVTMNSNWFQVSTANQDIGRQNETSTNTWSTMTGVDLQLGGPTEVRDFCITEGPTSTSAPLTPLSIAASANSTGTIAVTSNEVWNATSDSAWAVVSPAAGVSNGTVTVTCSTNAGSARTAHITINGNSIEVDQAATYNYLFNNWMSTNYPSLTGSNALPGAINSNNLTNLQHYAFGTDPTNNSAPSIAYTGSTLTTHGLPTASNLSGGAHGVNYKAVFCRRTNYSTAGLTYTVQFSADMSYWSNSADTPNVFATDGTIDAVSVPYPLFIRLPDNSVQKPTFFRVAVSMASP